MSTSVQTRELPAVDRLLEVRTPFGSPVGWGEVAMVTDIGDSHELNDDRCLVITSKDLGQRASGPLRDFMLCVLADGATGSTFAPRGATLDERHSLAHAGWRSSQLAQAVFVEQFLNSPEIDILDRLKDGLRAADRELVDSGEGSLSTTLTALFLASDGTAYAASIGDSVLLVLPPTRKTAGDLRLKKLGYEETTSVGSGDTTLSYVDENDLIEQWWPNKEGGRSSTRVEPGTYLVLMSDGIADNLPVAFIDQLVHRHPIDRATVGLPLHTRARRTQTQRHGGGSTSQLGLDNMSAIVIRYVGERRRKVAAGIPRLDDANLVTVMGTHGGPSPPLGGQFGMICLAGQEHGTTAIPGFLRSMLESELDVETMPARMSAAFVNALPRGNQTHLAALALDERGEQHVFSSGWVDMSLLPVDIAQRTVLPARDSVLQRFIYAPKLWASSLAALAMLLLVSTAFATGTVRPAPPSAPTVAPGEPTPTPDTRPMLAFGGLQLVPPAELATPTPVPTPAAASQPAQLDVHVEPNIAESAPESPPPPTQPPCRNIFGLLCGSTPPAPPRVRTQPQERAPSNDVLPVPSPGPSGDTEGRALGLKELAPPPGSRLDDALQAASVVDKNVHRNLAAGYPDDAGGP